MKKPKQILATAAAFAVVSGGLMIGSIGTASAATPTITAGPGSSVNCKFTAKTKLSPHLANDWVQSDHSTDPNADVRAIPDTTFAVMGPVTVSAKAKSLSCTGTVTDGVNTAPVTGMKVSLSGLGGSSSTEATCSGISDTSTLSLTSVIKWKATGAKVTDSTMTSSVAILADAHGIGFRLTATSISGSFGGGSSHADAYVDAGTINAIAGPAPTSASPNNPSTNPCQPSILIKAASGSHPSSAKLKKPKGFKKIYVGPAPDTTDSNLQADG